jgi:N-acetylglutamate synthase-like GNAT family acetyltransferase
MTLQIEARHNLSLHEIDAIEDRINEHNSHATGSHDGQSLAFVIHNESGRMIGGVSGYTWSGISELKQMWIDEAYRGRGYARSLLNAFIAEARHRGVRRIWVSSYDFQAPGLYEKAGFKRVAELEGWPEGHINVLLCKTLSAASRGWPGHQRVHARLPTRYARP